MTSMEWNDFVQPIRGQIAMLPGARPSSIRIDQLDQKVSLQEYERYIKAQSGHDDFEINSYLNGLSDDEENQRSNSKGNSQSSFTSSKNHRKGSSSNFKNQDFQKFPDGNLDTRWWKDKKISDELKFNLDDRYTTVQGHTPFHQDRLMMPVIVHHGVRPASLSYAGDPRYQKVWRSYLKLKHLHINKPNLTEEDVRKEKMREHILNLIRKRSDLKKETLNLVSVKDFHLTGLKSDVTSWTVMLPLLTHHIRYQMSLKRVEEILEYKFKERLWLTSALTHPSYQLNFGWNADHVRNAINNCGIRQPIYGDITKEQFSLRKKGITTLIRVMAKLGKQKSALSPIEHNERLEFLGDSVLGFIVSEALYRLFPYFSEGSLSILSGGLE